MRLLVSHQPSHSVCTVDDVVTIEKDRLVSGGWHLGFGVETKDRQDRPVLPVKTLSRRFEQKEAKEFFCL